MALIAFRPMERDDIPLYRAWAGKKHVRSTFFCDGEEPAEEIENKIAGDGYSYPHLILIGDRPIGYIVARDLYTYRATCPSPKGIFAEEPEGSYCIELFIGEEEFLNKGHGSEAIRLFAEMLFEEKGANRIVVDVDIDNRRAIRSSEKAGFEPLCRAHDGISKLLILEKVRVISRPKVSLFITSSLDSFIADQEGRIDFLNLVEAGGDDCGFGEFIREVDLIIVGRKTYETTLKFTEGKWPHQSKRVIVLSRTLEKVIPEAELYSGGLIPLMSQLHSEGVKHCWVDGGQLISAFLKLGFVDTFTLSIMPIILGGGVPLFQQLEKKIPLHLNSSKIYPFGVVQLTYSRVHSRMAIRPGVHALDAQRAHTT